MVAREISHRILENLSHTLALEIFNPWLEQPITALFALICAECELAQTALKS